MERCASVKDIIMAAITLGRLLERSRTGSGLSIATAASELLVAEQLLQDWELDRTTPRQPDVVRAAQVYSRGLTELWPERVSILDTSRPGVLVVGSEEIVRSEVMVANDPHEANLQLLRAYVAAVRRQRGISHAGRVSLRADDVAALAAELELSDLELTGAFETVFAQSKREAKATMQAILIGGLLQFLIIPDPPASWVHIEPQRVERQAKSTWNAVSPELVTQSRRGPLFGLHPRSDQNR